MDMPGSWHAGLCMAQSIFNVYFQELLGWKNLNSEVYRCYYQDARLITFFHDELLRFLTRQFVSQRESIFGEAGMKEGDYMTTVAKELQVFLQSLKSSDDKWIATCGFFWNLQKTFLTLLMCIVLEMQ